MISCLRTGRETVKLCLSLDADDCVRRTSTRAQRSEPTHVLVIAHSLRLDLVYGTVCQPANPTARVGTLRSENFDEHSNRIYLLTDSRVTVFFVRCV